MVGIFNYYGGLQFVAVAKDRASAIEAIYNKYKSKNEEITDPQKWWDYNRKINNGVPRCFEIKEIEVW